MTSLDVFSMYSPAAGSTRVRIYDWLEHLGLEAAEHQFAGLPNAGVSTLLSHRSEVARAEARVRRVPVEGRSVLMSREASPFSRGAVEERILRQAGHSAYDFDDALFHDVSPRRRAFGGSRKFERAVAAADVVIAGNAYLAEWAAQFADDVRIIPSCVDPGHYPMVDAAGRADKQPTLVWLGSGSTEQYLTPLVDALMRVHARTGARLKLISSPQANPALARLEPMLDRVPWTAAGFAAELAQSDVALAPLDDTPYARGKCAYKILQYGAAGLPVVGSPVGANEAALDRIGGLSLTEGDDWAEAVMQMLTKSTPEREAIGRAARAGVEQHYSFAAWAPQWRDALLAA
ncbi:glycosyltransferase [Dermacoccus nishinomiyaensis]|uniref:glycosyltransferase n=1 Tax=Dermacoccus nishinomiyaensis TaxID=1274 RepID=UPI0021A71E31|nr:glycosyltransferase [Dermacoccus nishinomiyaensis]MCT1603730.1 glycosyltransferase [Dermacoccus nishinomiyaensis]